MWGPQRGREDANPQQERSDADSLAAQASASRLLYAMGRDSVLPKAVFGRLNAKFHTPVVNLIVTGIIGLIAIFLDVATSTSFINFGAFTAFTLVNASVVFHYVRQRRAGHQLNAVSYVVVPGSEPSSAPTCSPSWTATRLRWDCPGWSLAWWSWPDHARLQGGTAGDDGHGKGDG